MNTILFGLIDERLETPRRFFVFSDF